MCLYHPTDRYGQVFKEISAGFKKIFFSLQFEHKCDSEQGSRVYSFADLVQHLVRECKSSEHFVGLPKCPECNEEVAEAEDSEASHFKTACSKLKSKCRFCNQEFSFSELETARE